MKIIEPGKRTEPQFPIQVRCDICKALLEVEKVDIKTSDYFPDMIPYRWIKCQECNQHIHITEGQ